MTGISAVQASDLAKSFTGPGGQPLRALDGVSFTIGSAGTVTSVAGPDGAGKSVLLAVLAGLIRPDGGSVSVFGLTPDPDDPEFVSRIGYMPQRFGLYEELSARENFDTFSALRGVPRETAVRRFAELMALTGLAGFEDRAAGALSGGMKQKLGLVCTLAAMPPLLILDEPTVGVDPLSRLELRRIIRRMTETAGLTCIMSTAYLEEAAEADKVLLMNEGRLLAYDDPARLTAGLRGRTWRVPVPPDGRDRTARQLMLAVRAGRPDSPILDAVPRSQGVDLLTEESLSSAPVPGAAPRSAVLEDVYCSLTFERKPGTPPSDVPSGRADDETVIRAEHISKRFGSFTAVADTCFTVRRGEIFGLLGPNGAGKTTTFRMLCGLLEPTSGTIRVSGVDMLSAKSEARRRIGYVAQRFSLYERLTVEENLQYFGESYGVWGRRLRSRLEELTASFRLGRWMKTRAEALPLGIRRELAMAAALIHSPDILFLDEATSGADVAARRSFWRRIVSLCEAGTTAVVTTHFMEEAEYFDRLLIQDAGRILASGAPADIRRAASPDGHPLSFEEAFIAVVRKHRREGAAA